MLVLSLFLLKFEYPGTIYYLYQKFANINGPYFSQHSLSLMLFDGFENRANTSKIYMTVYFSFKSNMDIKFIVIVHTCIYKQRNLKYLLPSILIMLSSTCTFYCNSFFNGFNLKHCLNCVLLYFVIWYFLFQHHCLIFIFISNSICTFSWNNFDINCLLYSNLFMLLLLL